MMQLLSHKKASIVLLLGFCLTQSLVFGQETKTLDEMRTAYPNDPIITLLNYDEVFIKLRSGKLTVSADSKERIMVLDNKLKIHTKPVYYKAGFTEISNLEAQTLNDENGRIRKIDAIITKESDHISDEFFYEGSKFKKIQFQGITNGSIMDMRYRTTYLDPHFITSFSFAGNAPIVQSQYIVHVPKNVQLGYRIYGDTNGVQFQITNVGDEKVYTWTANNVPALKLDDGRETYLKHLPHVFVFIKSYIDKGINIPYQSDLRDMYKFEYSFVANVNKPNPDQKLLKVTDSINVQYKTDLQKVRATFYWLQDNMQYIAFEDGMGSFRPREANDVFNKRYGDCKDFANLIVYMLAQMGIKANLAWLGTRDLPYSFFDLPHLSVSNHMIAAYFDKTASNWVFLDATSKTCKYPMPTAFIQGKEAMISFGADSFQIVKVPEIQAFENLYRDSVTVRIEKTVVKGNGNITMGGYVRSRFMDYLIYTGLDKRDEYYQNYLKLGNNKCKIEDFKAYNEDFRDSVLKVHYEFSLPDYIREVDNELFVNLNFRKRLKDIKTDTTIAPKMNREFKHTFTEHLVTTLVVPDGYAIKKIPQPFSFKNPYFTYKTQCVNGPKGVVLHEQYQFNNLVLSHKDFGDWNNLIDQINQNYQQLIVLKKK